MTDLRPTHEQHAIVTAAAAGKDLVVQAGAGTGKTSTLKMVARALRAQQPVYIAYNRSIATEAAASFPSHVMCRTAHSLALQAVGRRYAHRLKGPRELPSRRAEIPSATARKSGLIAGKTPMSSNPPPERTRRLHRAATAAIGILLATAAPITIPTAAAASPLAGKIVFLDPGHNGANDASISRQVPTGRGGTKDCQATGTTTDNGYPEHTFTWDTTLQIRRKLDTLGARTAMSRQNDTTIGPCVNQRAETANSLHPNAIVSIHADGGPPSGHGFHVNYSAPPLNATQAGPSVQFARIMRDQLQASGIPPANYIGHDGLYGRADLAGLNLARYPSILVELGNMKNTTEAAQMETPAGRQRYADAVVRGITTYLERS